MEKKKVIIGVAIIIGITLILETSFAKYELVKNIKIAEGTINYKVPDFKTIAMYKNDGDKDVEITTMPESGYIINETKSYCTLDNINKDTKAKLYTDEKGNHVISGLSKSDKCYLYFDNYKKINTALGEITVKLSTPDFSKTSCSSGCGEATVGIYQAKDNDGWSYYYRGDVENNYVKFAGFYWRIVRINGDGSIRLIYDGTSAHANGEETIDSIAVTNVKWSHKDAYWNSRTDSTYTNDNAYAGFQYTFNEVHGLGIKSNALQELETWYQKNLASYTARIDTNAGFCGDRTPNNGLGTGTTDTRYEGYIRALLYDNQLPILTCKNVNDLYTINASNIGSKSLSYPIGLISADEVAMAGGVWGKANKNYYLYNGQSYWTLTPSAFLDEYLRIYLLINSTGLGSNPVSYPHGLRSVINLRSNTKFIFKGTGEKGTITNPYIVE